MKPSPKFKLHVVIGAVILTLLFALFAYLVVIPAILPKTLDAVMADNLGWRFALLVFGTVAVSSIGVAAVLLYFLTPERSLQELSDAIRQPVLFIDENNRYLVINREAERILGLNRDRDVGKSIDSRITAAMADALDDPNSLNLKNAIVQNDSHYQVIDNPLPAIEGSGRRQRVIILREINNLVRLKDAIHEINNTMAILNTNTMKISSSAVSLSQGATEQATSLASITASMDEFSKKIQGNTESAAKSTQLAAQAREAAERSGGEIANALSAMTDVQEAGIRIARIVKLIDDIAFQTNLLALNAAVEAARAGRQGKGFAVVADEVRNLAGRSAKAAKDTASMVEDVTERIGNASAYISRLEEMLRNIVQDAIRMADSSASASTTSSEQASGILQVNHELGQMNSVTQNTMSAAEQTATAVEVLARQATMLKKKLDELADDFSLELTSEAISKKPTLSINLSDDFDSYGAKPRTHSYLTGDYGDIMAGSSPSRSSSKPSAKTHPHDDVNNWDLGADGGDTPLSNLFQANEYRDYVESNSKNLDSLGESLFKQKGPPPEIETPEGDRVVKPTQNIHLDDSEFGRY